MMDGPLSMGKTLGLATILIGLSGCSGIIDSFSSPDLDPSAPVPEAPALEAPTTSESDLDITPPNEQAAKSAPVSQPDNYFREAVNRATSAVAIGQSAQSADDWQLAVNRWQQAIDLMQKVSNQSANYAQAQTKIQEYQQHLNSAEQRAQGKPLVAPAPAQSQPQVPSGLVAQIPIRSRQGGIPVVPVKLQGRQATQTFPMLFDTGATGTLITPAMAQALGVTIIGETQARIADGSVVNLPIGVVDVLEVGGLRKDYVQVAIGGNVALLGQDVYGDYGIAIGSHMINLHP
jgi:predicted aspartyl protease